MFFGPTLYLIAIEYMMRARQTSQRHSKDNYQVNVGILFSTLCMYIIDKISWLNFVFYTTL